MMLVSMKIAMVTGANSGVGFETAFQLAAAGYARVILACRTLEKAAEARKQLLARGAAEVFETLALDTAEASSGKAAAKALAGRAIDLVILNAGAAGGSVVKKNSRGVDMTFASTLIGHHALTMGLLEEGGISEGGRILIAGSEAARGDVMGMTVPDLDAIGGSAHEMLEAFAKGSHPGKYDARSAYALAKLFAAWWAAELAPRLPKTMAVHAVSPGNTPSTNMSRDLPWPVRNIVFPIQNAIGPLFGIANSVEVASKRYLDAAKLDIGSSGKFFASPAKKLTGAMVEQHTKWLDDAAKRAAAYRVIAELAES